MNATTKRKVTKKEKEISLLENELLEIEKKHSEVLILKKIMLENTISTIFLSLALTIAFAVLALLLIAANVSLFEFSNAIMVISFSLFGAIFGIILNLTIFKPIILNQSKQRAEQHYKDRKNLIKKISPEERGKILFLEGKIKDLLLEKEKIIAGEEIKEKDTVDVPLPSGRGRVSSSKVFSVLPDEK